jgi:hypothetical protein
MVQFAKSMCDIWVGFGPNVSTTPITAMGCRQCLPLSVVQLKGKHCRKPHCRNGVVDTFGLGIISPKTVDFPIGRGRISPNTKKVISSGENMHYCRQFQTLNKQTYLLQRE